MNDSKMKAPAYTGAFDPRRRLQLSHEKLPPVGRLAMLRIVSEDRRRPRKPLSGSAGPIMPHWNENGAHFGLGENPDRYQARS